MPTPNQTSPLGASAPGAMIPGNAPATPQPIADRSSAPGVSPLGYSPLRGPQGAGGGTVLSFALSGATTGIGNTPITLTITPSDVVSATVSFSDGGAGGAFSPTSLAFSNSAGPQTVFYTPAIRATTFNATITATSTGGYAVTGSPLTISVSPLSYAVTLDGAINLTVNPIGQWSAYTVTPNGAMGGDTFTPSDGAAGGTFWPSSLTFSGSSPQTLYYLPVAGSATVSGSSGGGHAVTGAAITPGSASSAGTAIATLQGSGGHPAVYVDKTGWWVFVLVQSLSGTGGTTIGQPTPVTGCVAWPGGSATPNFILYKNGSPVSMPLYVTSTTLTHGGSGYTSATATFTPQAGDPGTGAQGTPTVSGGAVTGVSVNHNPVNGTAVSLQQSAGAGYLVPPTIAISGDGAGATFVANLGPLWCNGTGGQYWPCVAFPLPVQASPNDVFTYSAVSGWLSTAAGAIGYASHAPVQNYVGQLEPAPAGWQIAGGTISPFGVAPGALKAGVVCDGGVNPNSPDCTVRNWMHKAPFQWGSGSPQVVCDQYGNPTSITSASSTVSFLILNGTVNPVVGANGEPAPWGIYTYVADETAPTTPMGVSLSCNNSPVNVAIAQVSGDQYSGSSPGTVVGGTAVGKTWQWAIYLNSPMPINWSPNVYLNFTAVTGSSGNWAFTLQKHWFGSPQPYAPTGVGKVVFTAWGQNYTNQTAISFGGNNGGAAATANIYNGCITSVVVSAPGSNYSTGTTIAANGTGTGFIGKVLVSGGQITGVQVVDPGSGYGVGTSFSLPFTGGGSGATIANSASGNISNGCLRDATVTDHGSGMTAQVPVTITDPGGGTGAAAIMLLAGVAGVVDRTDDAATDPMFTGALTTPTGRTMQWARFLASTTPGDGESNDVDPSDMHPQANLGWSSYYGYGFGTSGHSSGQPTFSLTYGGQNYTTTPNVVILDSAGGTGTPGPASLGVATYNGAVVFFDVIAGGSGYTSQAQVAISDPSGTGASGTITLSTGVVSSIAVAAGGSGYSGPTVTVSGGGGTGAQIAAIVSNTKIVGFYVVAPGTGYSSPTVSISDPTGTGATATATLSGSGIGSVTVTAVGQNYSGPTAIVQGFSGKGATGTATLSGQAVASVSLNTSLSNGAYDGNTAIYLTDGSQPSNQPRLFSITAVGPFLPTGTTKVYVWDSYGIPAVSASPNYQQGDFSDAGPYYFEPTTNFFLSTASFWGTPGGWFCAQVTTGGPHGLKTGQTITLLSPVSFAWPLSNGQSGANAITGCLTSLSIGSVPATGVGNVAVWVTGANSFVIYDFKTLSSMIGAPANGPIATPTTTHNATTDPGVFPVVGGVYVPDPNVITWEVAADFSNSFNCNLILHIPSTISLTGVAAIAQRVLAVVSPKVKVAIEYCNEHWDLSWFRNRWRAALGYIDTTLYNGVTQTVPGYAPSQILGSSILNDWQYAKRAAQVHYVFWQVFNAAGRGAQIVRMFGIQYGQNVQATHMVDLANYINSSTANYITVPQTTYNGSTYPAASFPMQIDGFLFAPYPQITFDPTWVSAAAQIGTTSTTVGQGGGSDTRGLLYLTGNLSSNGGAFPYPMSRKAYASAYRHYLKYNQHDISQWTGLYQICQGYTNKAWQGGVQVSIPTALGTASPIFGCYENSINEMAPFGCGGSANSAGTGAYRTDLTSDLRYEPEMYWANRVLHEIAQDGGASFCCWLGLASPSSSDIGTWDGNYVITYQLTTRQGQPYSKGDGSDGYMPNQFSVPPPGGNPANLVSNDLTNSSIILQMWRDWADVANTTFAPGATTAPATRRWFPGLSRGGRLRVRAGR